MNWTRTSVVVVVAGLLLGLPAVVAAQRPTEGVGGGGGGGAAASRGGETGGGSGASGGSTSAGASGPISGPGGYSTPTGSAASGGGSTWGGSSTPMTPGYGGTNAIRVRDEIYQRPGFADVYNNNRGTGRNYATAPESPWYSRPRGSDVPATGTATLRTDYVAARPPGWGGGGNSGWGDGSGGGYYPYNNGYGYYGAYGYGWYLYPGYWNTYGYPDCGYGVYGMGYFYYNPFGWNYYGNCGYYGSGMYGGSSPYYGAQFNAYDARSGTGGGSVGYGTYQSRGGLRLKVKPTNARVYVDGYFAGKVDQFDGSGQKLEIERGTHKIEISALGYTPVVFEIEIKVHETITWEGNLELVVQKIK